MLPTKILECFLLVSIILSVFEHFPINYALLSSVVLNKTVESALHAYVVIYLANSWNNQCVVWSLLLLS